MSLTNRLLKAARDAQRNAYAPYSQFTVGAALLSASGKIFSGANVENVSYGLTCCAERNAIFQMVSSGETRFSDLLVIADTDTPVRPCGACLQVMVEFARPDSEIIMVGKGGEMEKQKLKELIPMAFTQGPKEKTDDSHK